MQGERDIHIRFEPREIIDKWLVQLTIEIIAGVVSAKEYATVDEILKIAKEKNEQPFIVILDGIDSPPNLGGIIRTLRQQVSMAQSFQSAGRLALQMLLQSRQQRRCGIYYDCKVGNINNTILSSRKAYG